MPKKLTLKALEERLDSTDKIVAELIEAVRNGNAVIGATARGKWTKYVRKLKGELREIGS